MYYNNTSYLNNFLSVIDIKNFKQNEEASNIIKFNKQILINDFIKKMEINIFDKTFKISQENLINNFTSLYNNSNLFKSSIFNNKYDFNNINKPKHLVGFINSLLSSYCIKLSSNKKTKYGYSIKILYYADEILNNKINNGYKINDEYNLFNFNVNDIQLKHLYKNYIFYRFFYKVCKNVLYTISFICLKKYNIYIYIYI